MTIFAAGHIWGCARPRTRSADCGWRLTVCLFAFSSLLPAATIYSRYTFDGNTTSVSNSSPGPLSGNISHLPGPATVSFYADYGLLKAVATVPAGPRQFRRPRLRTCRPTAFFGATFGARGCAIVVGTWPRAAGRPSMSAMIGTILGGVLGKDKATLRQIIDACRQTYCGTIGVEFHHIQHPQQRDWLVKRFEKDRLEPSFSVEGKKAILERLTEAEGFEKFLGIKYTGTKRFGLDGGEAAIPALEQILKRGGQLGVKQVVIGMGDAGLATRVLPGRFHSAWTYAGTLSGIGQVTAHALLGHYRFRSLNDDTAIFASRSPPTWATTPSATTSATPSTRPSTSPAPSRLRSSRACRARATRLETSDRC